MVQIHAEPRLPEDLSRLTGHATLARATLAMQASRARRTTAESASAAGGRDAAATQSSAWRTRSGGRQSWVAGLNVESKARPAHHVGVGVPGAAWQARRLKVG
jgi:hypothetical protein